MGELLGTHVDPALRSSRLTAIGDGMEAVATKWHLTVVENRPLGEPLEGIREEYSVLMGSLPFDSTADEIEAVMKRCQHGMKLREDHPTSTQNTYVLRGLGFYNPFDPGKGSYIQKDETYDYLVVIANDPNTDVNTISTCAVIYVKFHRDAGASFPTFDEKLMEYLCKPDVQEEITNSKKEVILDPLVRVHSRWIARKLAEEASTELGAEDGEPDYSHYDGDVAGSWLDNLDEE